MSSKNLVVSFSGGETSAYMTKFLIEECRHIFPHVKVVFANTGQEHPKTLDFVKKCDDNFNFNTVWVEAVQHHNERKAATHRITDYTNADRNGLVYEDAIKKYGIPNQAFPHCTRDLKLAPINSYIKSLGWWGDCVLAIGIRADEIDRMSTNYSKNKIIYPLITFKPTTKKQINSWWENQEFRLELTGYQGNCTWCWKKTLRKHYTLIKENPEYYNFPKRMEEKYSKIGPEFKKNHAEGYKRSFFRGDISTEELFEKYEAVKDDFEPYHDENRVYDDELDIGGGCGESCEVFSDNVLMSYGDGDE